MKRLLSTAYSETAFNIGTFVLRAALGLLMCFNHGFDKVKNFNESAPTFFDPFHIGHKWSLMLCIFAELFAAMLLALGLFSRIAAFILVINMAVAVYAIHHSPIKQSEEAIIYLAGFFILLLIGPGKYSVDGMSGK